MWQYLRVKFSGRLDQKSYCIAIIVQFSLSLTFLIAASGLLEVLGANHEDASDTNKVIAVIVSVVGSVGFLYTAVAMLGSIARRANDTALFYAWLTVGLLAPFGLLIIALVPSAKNKS